MSSSDKRTNKSAFSIIQTEDILLFRLSICFMLQQIWPLLSDRSTWTQLSGGRGVISDTVSAVLVVRSHIGTRRHNVSVSLARNQITTSWCATAEHWVATLLHVICTDWTVQPLCHPTHQLTMSWQWHSTVALRARTHAHSERVRQHTADYFGNDNTDRHTWIVWNCVMEYQAGISRDEGMEAPHPGGGEAQGIICISCHHHLTGATQHQNDSSTQKWPMLPNY